MWPASHILIPLDMRLASIRSPWPVLLLSLPSFALVANTNTCICLIYRGPTNQLPPPFLPTQAVYLRFSRLLSPPEQEGIYMRTSRTKTMALHWKGLLDTGSPPVNAIIWVKPGGKFDGTRNAFLLWACVRTYVPHPPPQQELVLIPSFVVIRPPMLLKLGLGSRCVCGRGTYPSLCSSLFLTGLF